MKPPTMSEPVWAIIDGLDAGDLIEIWTFSGDTDHGQVVESDSHGFTLEHADASTRLYWYGSGDGTRSPSDEVEAVEIIDA